MVNYHPNKFFKGSCSNEGNERSNILRYHIYTLRDVTDYNQGIIQDEINSPEEYYNLDGLSKGDPYYGVYGTSKTNVWNGPIKIFETDELRVAIYVLEQLTGNKVVEDEIFH